MKVASVQEIKQELKTLSQPQLIELCLRLVKYKKENKELFTFLLFEAADLTTFVSQVRREIDEIFSLAQSLSHYQAKKAIRKALRVTNKFIRYCGEKQVEVELLIYFCTRMKECSIRIRKSRTMINLYNSQLKKINSVIQSLHEDLQRDFERQIQQSGLASL